MQHNVSAFFGNDNEPGPVRGPAKQQQQAAADVFWGVEPKVQGRKAGHPIPGTGTF